MTLKQDFIDLAYDLTNNDPDLSTISVDLVHRKPVMQSYDAQTGDIFEFHNDSVVRVFMSAFTKDKFNGQDVLTGDVRVFLPLKGLTQDVDLQNDLFITDGGDIYNVVQKIKDASDAGYVMQMRLRHEQTNNLGV